MTSTVLVTGASSGIGRAAALALAQRGFTVYGGARGELDLDGVTRVQLDVTDADDLATLADLELDGLVNNAGIAVTGPLEFLPIDELRRQLEVNTVAQLAVTQACLPALRRSRGRIVNVSSISGRVALPLFGPYAASKFAFEALSDALRRELRGSGIEVSLIEPGAVRTPIWDRSIDAGDRLWGAMPALAHERYGALVDTVRGLALKSAEEGMPVEVVVAAIHHALTASRPRTRYVLGREARIQAVLGRFLPTRAMDAMLARVLRQ